MENNYDVIVIGTGHTGGWAAKELCEKGYKDNQIAKEFGVKPWVIKWIRLNKLGIKYGETVPVSREEIEQMIKLSLKGSTIGQIAKTLNRSRCAVSRHLKKEGFLTEGSGKSKFLIFGYNKIGGVSYIESLDYYQFKEAEKELTIYKDKINHNFKKIQGISSELLELLLLESEEHYNRLTEFFEEHLKRLRKYPTKYIRVVEVDNIENIMAS